MSRALREIAIMAKDYMTNNLKELNEVFKYTKEKIESLKEISIERNRKSIKLFFDDGKRGFGGFETVTIEVIEGSGSFS